MPTYIVLLAIWFAVSFVLKVVSIVRTARSQPPISYSLLFGDIFHAFLRQAGWFVLFTGVAIAIKIIFTKYFLFLL